MSKEPYSYHCLCYRGDMMEAKRIESAVESRLPLAESLFDRLFIETRDDQGVTRPAWSRRDQRAADLIAEDARSLDLEVTYDPAGNLYATLPGKNRSCTG